MSGTSKIPMRLFHDHSTCSEVWQLMSQLLSLKGPELYRIFQDHSTYPTTPVGGVRGAASDSETLKPTPHCLVGNEYSSWTDRLRSR